MNRNSGVAKSVQQEDVLADIARTIGSALGTVASKIAPARKAIRQSVHKAQKTEARIVKAATARLKKRSSSPKSGAAKSKAKSSSTKSKAKSSPAKSAKSKAKPSRKAKAAK